MQISFIDQVAASLSKDNNILSRTCVVLPTKRACIYFRSALLKERASESVWLPEILSLQEFLYREAPLSVCTEENLLAMLYKIHGAVTHQQQPLSSFYKWGQMILKDFNDVDQYLIDPEYLFHYVDAYKKIDHDNKLTARQVSWLQQFWNTVPESDSSRVRDDFLQTWEHLGQIYHAFKEVLTSGGLGYEGLAYRLLLEELETGGKRFAKKYFHLVGFNALSAFEERLFSHLIEQYETTVYWDAETSMLEHPEHESGMFIKRYLKLFDGSSSILLSPAMDDEPKKVEVINAGMDADQCKTALDLANRWGEKETVIVLCDESLVVPMIFQLDEGTNANLTMGYPLSLSGYNSFLKKLCVFKEGMLPGGRFNSILLMTILKFPPIRRLLPDAGLLTFENEVQKRGYLGADEVRSFFPAGEPMIEAMLSDDPVIEYVQGVLEQLQSSSHEMENTDGIILKACQDAVTGLQEWLYQYDLRTEPKEISRLLQIRLASSKIPFGNNEQDGLQIMGFLETRNLDFRNVIILGANDEHLPGTSRSSSFIPYTIRKGLGMPTYHENDAIHGYHFFRLLQRAEHVALIYTSQSAGKKLSRSRFVEQVLYEWATSPKTEVSESRIHIPVPRNTAVEPVAISKGTPESTRGLNLFLNGERQLSASAINTYIRCPFQFYLKYIAGLEEIEELSADLDQRDLGKIFHKAMELFYRPFLDSGELINKDVLSVYKKITSLDRLIIQAFELEHYHFPKSGIKGKNLLVKKMIEAMMESVIECDLKSEPFRITGLEQKLDKVPFAIGGGRQLLLKGYLDRVDKVESSEGAYTRIIDYKTGNAKFISRRSKTAEEYFSKYFSDPTYKEGLQAYLYCWMYDKVFPGNQIRSGFYTARELSRGLKLVQDGNTIAREDYLVFEDNLGALLEEMFDLSVPFIQTDDDKAYQYSSFDVLIG